MDKLVNKEVSVKNLTKIEVPNLPTMPFRGIFQGGSGQGKTNAIVNFVRFYKDNDLFDKIYVICPTRDLKLLSLVEDKEDFYLAPTFDTVETIVERIKEDVRRYKRYLKDKEFYESIRHKKEDDLTMEELSRIERMEEFPPKDPFGRFPQSLLIVDDSIGSALFSTSRKNSFVNFYIRSRHQGCSVILSTQHWSGLNRSLRANATFFVIFKMNDKKQLYDIFLEITSFLDFDTFMRVFQEATKEKYHFLFVDIEKGEFRRDFNTPIDF